MNTLLRALLAGVFAATLLTACNKAEEAAEAAKGEMSEAVDATKDAAAATATEASGTVMRYKPRKMPLLPKLQNK
jgi:hypothetical protein